MLDVCASLNISMGENLKTRPGVTITIMGHRKSSQKLSPLETNGSSHFRLQLSDQSSSVSFVNPTPAQTGFARFTWLLWAFALAPDTPPPHPFSLSSSVMNLAVCRRHQHRSTRSRLSSQSTETGSIWLTQQQRWFEQFRFQRARSILYRPVWDSTRSFDKGIFAHIYFWSVRCVAAHTVPKGQEGKQRFAFSF